MIEVPIKKRRGRPRGSYKKPNALKIYEQMPDQDKRFLQEAKEGDRYPAREHKVVERACAAIEKETGIVVTGDARLLLYAAHQLLVSWMIHGYGLDGLAGGGRAFAPRTPGMAKNTRRAEVFKYLKFSFEKATGQMVPAWCNERETLFLKFVRAALSALAPSKFIPKNLAKAIENALKPFQKKRLGRLAPSITLTVKFPGTN